MKHVEPVVDPGIVYFGVFLFVLILGVLALSASFSGHVSMSREMEKDDCKLASQAPTGKKIYCGKACWKDEMRTEYSCKSGTRVVIQ